MYIKSAPTGTLTLCWRRPTSLFPRGLASWPRRILRSLSPSCRYEDQWFLSRLCANPENNCKICTMVFSFLSFQNPRQYKIPDWFLNRQRDIKDGKTNQVFITIFLHITVLQSITYVRSWRMCWTTSSVRILSAWRRFVPTGVLGTTWALGWVELTYWLERCPLTFCVSPGEGSAHQDHWSQGKDGWCVKEEVDSICCFWKTINSVYFALSCVSLMQLYITNTV